jgi:hypothetical protein
VKANYFVALSGVLADNAADPSARQAAGINMKNALDAQVRALAQHSGAPFTRAAQEKPTNTSNNRLLVCTNLSVGSGSVDPVCGLLTRASFLLAACLQNQQTKVERMQRWLTLDPAAKGQVKQVLVQTFAAEDRNARRTAAQVTVSNPHLIFIILT